MNFLKHIFLLLKEMIMFSIKYKKWYIVPLILVFLIVGLLVFIGQASAPFIYTMF